WIRRHFKAIRRAAAAAGAIAVTLPGTIQKDVRVPFGKTIKQILRRLRSLEKRIGVTAGAAIVAAALARLGLGWIRCANVKRVGKAVCGFDRNWLNTIL